MKSTLKRVSRWGAVSKLDRLSTGRKVTYAAVLLIVLQLAFRGSIVGRSWFLVDDFLFLSDVASGLDSLSWYFQIHQGHFMPASFVLVKIVGSIGSFNWAAAAVEIVALQLLASIACYWMLRNLFGNRPTILVPFAFYLFSALTMPSILWWAVAINQLPNQIACFGAIAAHVSYSRSGKWRAALLASAFLILGFVTYTKTLFLPPILVLITVMYFASGPLGRRLRDSLLQFWKAWVAYTIVTASFLAAYLYFTPQSIGGRGSSLLELSGSTVLESFGTSMIGGPWKWSLFGRGPISYTNAPDLGVVAAWILIAALVFVVWATRERSLRALWVIGFYLAASILTVYYGRDYVLALLGGSSVGHHLQYLADSAPFVVVTIGLMTMSLIGAVESSEARSRPLFVRLPSCYVFSAVGMAIFASSIYSSVGIAKPWDSNFLERSFTQRAAREIVREKPLFADVGIPEGSLSALFAPYNEIRRYFSPLGAAVRTTRIGNDLKVLGEDGSIAPAVLDGPIRTEADSSKTCPIRVKNITTTIPFVPVFNYPFWMAIEYTSNADAHIPLDYGIFRKDVPIENGSHTLFIATTGAYDSVTLRPLVGQQICVKSIKVGTLIPQAAP